MDPSTRAVTFQGNQVTLGSNEFSVLEALLSNIGRVLSRAQLEESLYGWGEGVESNTIEVYISYLRKKLGKGLIRTVRGIGYTIPKLTGQPK
jgi:DNA-binding response OmpR family regulator